MPPPAKSDLHLLALPAEVLIEISRQLCIDIVATPSDADISQDIFNRGAGSPVGIIHVCKNLREQYLPMMLHKSTFCVPNSGLTPGSLANALRWPALCLIRKLRIDWQLRDWFLDLWIHNVLEKLKELTVIWSSEADESQILPPSNPKDYPFLISLLGERFIPDTRPGRLVGQGNEPDDDFVGAWLGLPGSRPIKLGSAIMIPNFGTISFGPLVPIEARGDDRSKIDFTVSEFFDTLIDTDPEPKVGVIVKRLNDQKEYLPLPGAQDMMMWLVTRGRSKLGPEVRAIVREIMKSRLKRGLMTDGIEIQMSMPFMQQKLAEFEGSFTEGDALPE